jgi:hypothetical protein
MGAPDPRRLGAAALHGPPAGDELSGRDRVYLLVKTRDDSFLVDVGDNPVVARNELAEAKKLMDETGSVTIGGSLVVMASDIESIALQDSD